MSILLECKKMKKTGFYPAFIVGGILASCLPVINMAVRSEIFTGLQQPPLQILLNENWAMMAMLNILLILSGACIMYHTENAERALQKMQTLPIRESSMFFAKFILMIGMSIVVLATEAISFLFCSLHWFHTYDGLYTDLLKNFAYFFILLLPAILLSLAISSACSNMWISLGIGVVCFFAATMITSTSHFILQIFPFCLPLRILTESTEQTVIHFLVASVLELLAVGIAELSFLRIRKALV